MLESFLWPASRPQATTGLSFREVSEASICVGWLSRRAVRNRGAPMLADQRIPVTAAEPATVGQPIVSQSHPTGISPAASQTTRRQDMISEPATPVEEVRNQQHGCILPPETD